MRGHGPHAERTGNDETMRGMNNMQANICLLAVTLCWSCEVVLLALLPDGVNPFATTCVTSLIAAVLLFTCFFRRIVSAFKRERGKLARRILLLSVMNASYNVLIEEGFEYFDVSVGAFTLSMTVVVLPVMLLVMRRGVEKRTWGSALCVLAGVIIAMFQSFEQTQAPGLVIMITSCIIRALYIVKLNDFAREHEAVTLAAGMSAGNTVLTFIPWCAMEPTTFLSLPWSPTLIAVYFVLAYFIGAFASIINIFAQRRASAAHSTIIYSTEIVFSTIWATCLPASIIDRVEVTPALVIGCALIILGNLVKIAPSRREDEESEEGGSAPAAQPDKDDEIVLVPDIVSSLLRLITSHYARNVIVFAILLAVYLVISLPFKVLIVIPGFADIRPVCMLMPVYGIFFGLPGCFAFAVGNLLGDIASDSLRWSSIAGFVANFVYPYLMYLYWTQLRKKPFRLRGRRVTLFFAVSIFVCACIQALIITPAVAVAYPEVDAAFFALTVVANESLFPIGFAIPFIILIQEELGFVPILRGRHSPDPRELESPGRG